jgi:hypothetical protein
VNLEVVPVTLKQACAYVTALHRHHAAPRGHKFSLGLTRDGELCGVAMVGRPLARALDDGRSAEVNRTCTDGTPNANSMLYGAAWRAAKAMGYLRMYTYTQEGESGASLRAAGYLLETRLTARKSWAEHSVGLKGLRDPVGAGGVARLRWRIGRDRT